RQHLCGRQGGGHRPQDLSPLDQQARPQVVAAILAARGRPRAWGGGDPTRSPRTPPRSPRPRNSSFLRSPSHGTPVAPPGSCEPVAGVQLHKERTMKLTKILVPLDGSSRAAVPIETAIDLAAAPCSLVLLRAAEAHVLPAVDPTEMQVAVVREAEEYLASVRDDLAKRGITNVETSVWYGAPAHAIIEGARIQKADL